jgi:filamentous hemagglutinin family protein
MPSTKLQPRVGFRPKLIALSVAACFSLSSTQSLANPTGGTVSSGSAGFASSGNTLTITNSANAIINWQSFSIGVNEITRFLQSSASSAVLNKVVGSNGVIPQSVIDGVLSSNGRVFLINQSGILFGANARIDVAGLVASSLNLSDQDFLNGRMRFTETPGAGAVSNAGIIDTTSGGAGGRVYLVGPDVQNSGVIRSPQGEIILAAGKSVELVSEGSPFVTVHLVADTEQALNVGRLISDSGRIGMFGALVRQGGVVEANSAVAGANGEIRLVATKDLTLDAGSLTTANGPSGGSVLLQAQGGTNLISGTVEAKGSSGQGGTIQALGVRVGVIGNGVIDASGDAGGGTVLVGGDYQGANPGIQNARQAVIGPDGIIRADAGTTGDGGRVIVWSDDSTKFFGSISARGGAQSGNGGFVETSGAALQAFGSVDTRAPNGKGGSWLLDPDFIEIVATGGLGLTCTTLTPALCFDSPLGITSQVSLAAIDSGLRSIYGSVTLQAHKDITLLTDLTLNVGGNFTAQAGNNINLHGLVGAVDTGFNIVANGTNIKLIANDASSGTPSGTGKITSFGTYGNISTNGGKVDLSGFGIAVGNVNTSGGAYGAGSVTVAASSDIFTGLITTASATAGYGGGSVDLFTGGGKVTVNGNIITSGALGSGASTAGSNGGSVKITSPGAATIYGGIVTSGGGGYGAIAGQGGAGGAAGNIFISSAGGVLVQGNIGAQGGSGGSSNNNGLAAFAGGAGGLGGSVSLGAGGKVTVGTGSGTIDVSGGSGGAGSPAVVGTVTLAGGAGGAGGSAGFAQIFGGQGAAVGNILAVGGVGGYGGNGISASAYGGAGGDGGLGGAVFLGANATSGPVTRGTINVDGGAAGAGGAYGGYGGNGGSGGAVFMLGDTIDLSTGGAITAAGGIGGAGGVGNTVVGGKGGNGGNGGLIHLIYGSTILFTPPLNASVSGGVGGAAGLTGGVAGVKGVDGTILISKFDFGTSRIPQVDLNAPIKETNRLTLSNNAPSAEELEKRDKENKQKKDVAVCK